jgi:hypothetical protein
MSYNQFPKDIVLVILRSLDAESLSKLICCSQELRDMIFKLNLWKYKLIQDFPTVTIVSEITDYKVYYRQIVHETVQSLFREIDSKNDCLHKFQSYCEIISKQKPIIIQLKLLYKFFDWLLTDDTASQFLKKYDKLKTETIKQYIKYEHISMLYDFTPLKFLDLFQ